MLMAPDLHFILKTFFPFYFYSVCKRYIVCKNKLCVVITSQFWDYKWDLLNLNLVFMWYSWYTAWDGSKPKYSGLGHFAISMDALGNQWKYTKNVES